MNILTYSMSLNGEYSSTLTATKYIADAFTKRGDVFKEIIMPKNGKVTDEDLKAFEEADLIIMATSMYHFLIASQAMDAMQVIGKHLKKNCPNKPVTVFMTSNYLMDPLVRQYVESWAASNNLNYIKGYNMHMDDILVDEKRLNAYAWFESVKLVASGESIKADEPATACIILADNNDKTAELAKQYQSEFESRGLTVKLVKVSDYNIKPCIGCQACYTNRHCFMENTDDFTKMLSDTTKDIDIVLTVGELNNGYFSSDYKKFFDRHVFMGRCPYPYDAETINLYAYYKGEDYTDGDVSLINTWANAMHSFGGEVFIGVVEGMDVPAVNATIAALNAGCAYYDDMYRTYITKQFADLAINIQNIEPLDYKCFQARGCYEPVPINPNCRPIQTVEAAKKACEMKSFAVRSYRSQADCTYTKPERRKHKSEDILNLVQNPPYANDSAGAEKKKKGFFGFGKK